MGKFLDKLCIKKIDPYKYFRLIGLNLLVFDAKDNKYNYNLNFYI